jgi:hypothetical protein
MVVVALAASVAGGVSAQGPSAGGPAPGREPQSFRITPENVRFSNYLRELAGPRALVGVIGGGVLGHLRQHDGRELGDRIAERATQHAVKVSVVHGLAALMHRSTDSHFQFCECHGFGPRVQHALLEGFAGLPFEQNRSVGNVATGATLSLGFSALFNIGRELTGLGRPKAHAEPLIEVGAPPPPH